MSSRTRSWIVAVLAVVVMVPLAAVASHRFTDVSDSNVFHDDIAWLADARVTLGCNPPANDEFCPGDNVTRDQMAAFMRRLAENQVVDAGTIQGMEASELIQLDGQNSTEIVELPESTPTRVLQSDPLTVDGEGAAQISYNITGLVDPSLDTAQAEISTWLLLDDTNCASQSHLEESLVSGSANFNETVTVGSTYLLTFDDSVTVTLCARSDNWSSSAVQAALNFVISDTVD